MVCGQFSLTVSIFVYAVVGIVILKMTICIKLETDWAKAVAKAMNENDAEEAKKYSHFSRRDSTKLNSAQMGSAVIESMSENLIDFKLSPMMSFALFGVTGAIAFRAINTLDGMVGFKTKEHINTGWFSANLDNFVNYIPTRLTALLMIVAAAILRMDAGNAWRMARRDHKKTPSRNHGWPMAAVAGALRIQLEKPGQYILGDAQEPLTGEKILGALRITRCNHHFMDASVLGGYCGYAVLLFADLTKYLVFAVFHFVQQLLFSYPAHEAFNCFFGVANSLKDSVIGKGWIYQICSGTQLDQFICA